LDINYEVKKKKQISTFYLHYQSIFGL